jgi:hypothetical protein
LLHFSYSFVSSDWEWDVDNLNLDLGPVSMPCRWDGPIQAPQKANQAADTQSKPPGASVEGEAAGEGKDVEDAAKADDSLADQNKVCFHVPCEELVVLVTH